MKIADIKKNAEQRMHKSLEALKIDLGKVRTGRAHTGILDHVTVDYYGTPTPIPQIANVTLIDNRTIGVTPWDKKMAGAVEKAIRNSDLGLNPATSGDIIRVPMPALTEERRKELGKVVRDKAYGVEKLGKIGLDPFETPSPAAAAAFLRNFYGTLAVVVKKAGIKAD